MATDIPPNQSIYVRNLFDKLTKDETRKLLYALFGQFGKILDVVVMKTERLRGQAWIVFADITAATNSLRAMQGFPFYDKPLVVEYAKGKSDAVARLDGGSKKQKKARQQAAGAAEAPPTQREKEKHAAAAASKPAAAVVEVGEPHSVLFVENLPAATTTIMMSLLFEQFPGYKESRLVQGRPGIAFVDFETETQAGVALAGLQSFKISPQHAMRVTYAKKSS